MKPTKGALRGEAPFVGEGDVDGVGLQLGCCRGQCCGCCRDSARMLPRTVQLLRCWSADAGLCRQAGEQGRQDADENLQDVLPGFLVLHGFECLIFSLLL